MPIGRMLLTAATLVLSGCSNFDLARLAPPGIIKYEDIAGEKPPNPAIKEAVAARKETADPRFPVLSQTPAAGPPPARPDMARVNAEAAELTETRASLDAGLAEDRAAAKADRAERDALDSRRDSLAEEIDKDAQAASRERAEPMPTADDTAPEK